MQFGPHAPGPLVCARARGEPLEVKAHARQLLLEGGRLRGREEIICGVRDVVGRVQGFDHLKHVLQLCAGGICSQGAPLQLDDVRYEAPGLIVSQGHTRQTLQIR
eukprot:9295652-Alexandrium_andersonii.AAC.1